jgi:hypothetical protein
LTTDKTQTFSLIFDKKIQEGNYIMGCDPYDTEEETTSYSAIVITKPRREYSIKRVRGFKRVINTGWSYLIEKVI